MKKGQRKLLTYTSEGGMERAPLASVSKGVIYFLIGYYSRSKECLKVVKILLDPLP